MSPKALTYDDVILEPHYSDILSRSEVSLATELGRGLNLMLPIISSPMDTISEDNMACAMDKAGGTSVIHRYNSIEQQGDLIASAVASGAIEIGAAVGVNGDFLERAEACWTAGATFICVDVAHGHHLLMKKALHRLRGILGGDVHLMAGNVATLEGLDDLSDWGADSARCNIGGGSICSTRVQTGHGKPGLQTIMDCSRTDRDIAIIADGGIRSSGDIVKALAAGADAVMVGSMLSGTKETPGQVFSSADGTKYKTYRGMASKEAQIDWRGRYSSFEGITSSVPYRGKVANILFDVENNIRSGLSYSGARSIAELQAHAIFIEQTGAGLGEGKTHITNRSW